MPPFLLCESSFVPPLRHCLPRLGAPSWKVFTKGGGQLGNPSQLLPLEHLSLFRG